jgi:hypothetical protein
MYKKIMFKYFIFWLPKNDKLVDFSKVYFHIYKFYQIFFTAHNTKNFVISFCMLVGYIYLKIWFIHGFKLEMLVELGSQMYFPYVLKKIQHESNNPNLVA